MAFIIPALGAAAGAIGSIGGAAAAGAGAAAAGAGAAAAGAGAATAGISTATAVQLGLAAASVAATGAATISSAQAAREQGLLQQRIAQDQAAAARFEAEQFELRANEERAAGTRRAAEAKRQRDIALSAAQARGAGSGGGRSFDIESDLEEQGVLESLTAIYDGEINARNFRTQAAVRRADSRSLVRSGATKARVGEAARRAGFIKGGATIASQVGSIAMKYA